MGYFRFFRRKKIGPGLTLNMSKSGPSVSIGPRGAKVTLGRRGVRTTVGVPGTGLYYTSLPKADSPRGSSSMATAARVGIIVVIVAVLAALAGSNPGGKPPAGNLPAASYGLGVFGSVATDTSAPELTATPGAVGPATARPKATPHPKPKPTPRATPRPTPRPTTAPASGVYGNPWGYDFRPGSVIYSPPTAFCSYFPCMASFGNSAGYVIQCIDGDFSTAGGRQGACSHHRGVRRVLHSH